MRSLTSQLGLFAAPAETRQVLDATSWVEHLRGWYPTPDLLYRTLETEAGWEQRVRRMWEQDVIEPRLTAEYAVLTDRPELAAIGARLLERYGVTYDSAWLNLYRDHRDSTAWHADRGSVSLKRSEAIVPVLSLGETRRFFIRPRDGGRSTTFIVESGDLIVMGGRCQRDWVHAVPKETTPCGPRISVNFGSSFQATPDP